MPVSRYLMRRISQFLQVVRPRTNNSLSLSSSIDRPSSQLFSSPRSSSSYIRMLTLQITQEEIDVMTRSGARSSITSTIYFEIVPSDVHGRDAPM